MLRQVLILFLSLATTPFGAAVAKEIMVKPGAATLQQAISMAASGDVLVLEAGRYEGPITVDRPLTISGNGAATIDGRMQGTVVTVAADDVTLNGLIVTRSGRDPTAIDSGIKITKGVHRALIESNHLNENLHGIDVHGAIGTTLRGNTITGLQTARMNERGNGIYVWNAPDTLAEGNSIRYGRDGIFSNTSKKDIYRNNLFRDLRFAVHYMYTNDSEISGNVSIGNHLGFAVMFSERVVIKDNLSLSDRDYGLLMNATNRSDVVGNLVTGGARKCLFMYNANRNLVAENRFETCDIGIHFTAGSEKNALTGNAFVANQNQVKYVGTRDIEWSLEGAGNYWSDLPAFDLNGDGQADSPFRPNDLMDHILWSQPAASLLLGSPAVQLIRWSQSSFPATLPGGVVDSHPQMKPVLITVSPEHTAMQAQVADRWLKDTDYDADTDTTH